MLKTNYLIYFLHFKTKINIIICCFIEVDAGFTQEWASTTNQRIARRQIEVQANNSGNPNRSVEYRTITTTAAATTTDANIQGGGNTEQPQISLEQQEESKSF